MYKQILSVLVFVLFLGACQSPDPTVTVSPGAGTNTPTPLPPGVILVPLSAVMPSPAPASPAPGILDLIIVLDKSRSMTKCTNWLYDNQQDLMSQKIVQFFYTLFDPAKVKVRVIYLPRKDAEIKFVGISDGLILSEKLNSTDNHYITAFEAIKTQLTGNYLVLMISDGAFNDPQYTGNRNETMEWLVGNKDFRDRLYVIQPECPGLPDRDKDKQMWQGLLSNQYLEASDRKSVGDFLQEMINNTGLKDALPVNGQFWDEEPKPVPGNTFEVVSKVWGIWDVTEPQLRMSIGDTLIPPQINSRLPGDGEKLRGPKSASSCPEHIPDITENPDIILAYYVIETVPVHQYLVLNPVQLSTGTQQEFSNSNIDEDVVIWNPTSLGTKELLGDLVAEGGYSLVQNYKGCYSFSAEFTFQPDKGAEQKCSINDNSIAWSDVFSGKNYEYPCKDAFKFDGPGEFHTIFRLKDSSGNVQQEWRNTSNISIRFYPEMKQTSIKPISEGSRFRYEIPFEYAKCQFYNGEDEGCLSRMTLRQVHENEGGGNTVNVYGIPDAVPITTFINDKKPGKSPPDNPIFFEVRDDRESIYLFVDKEYPVGKFLVYWNENTPAYFCTLQQPGQDLSCNLAREEKDGEQ